MERLLNMDASNVVLLSDGMYQITCRMNHVTTKTRTSAKNCRKICIVCSQSCPKASRIALEKIVNERGGSFDVTEYKGCKIPIKFTCSAGHAWKAAPGNVKNLSSWCPICAGCDKATALVEFERLVIEKGGRIEIAEYKNTMTPISISCAEGHTWNARPLSIKQGEWCPLCAKTKKKNCSTEIAREKLSEVVKKLGGSVDMLTYKSSRDPMEFTCSQGHKWLSWPTKIINRKTWCRVCSGNDTSTAQAELVEIVSQKGGRVDISTYNGINKPLTFTCAQNHSWTTAATNVKNRKTWCPKCAKMDTQAARDTLVSYVTKQGGSVDISQYTSANKSISFTCQHGHLWKATPASVRNRGTWCLVCSGKDSKTSVTSLAKIIHNRKGTASLDNYRNNRSKIEFQCEKGHKWSATASSVKQGSWCPRCRESRGEELCRNSFARVGISYVSQYRLHPTRLIGDFFITSHNLLIEFDGEQHFTQQWAGKKNPKIRENDLRKNQWAKDHAVHFLRIPYSRLKEVDQILRETLEQLQGASASNFRLEPPSDYFDVVSD